MSRFFGKKILSLEQFMLRTQVLQLYKRILRNVKEMGPNDGQFVKEWAKSDFERFKHIEDQNHIKTLISQGKAQLRDLEKSVTLSKRKF